jgi:hypothetical protein
LVSPQKNKKKTIAQASAVNRREYKCNVFISISEKTTGQCEANPYPNGSGQKSKTINDRLREGKWNNKADTWGNRQENLMLSTALSGFGGRYWDRTSDPCRVKAVLYP